MELKVIDVIRETKEASTFVLAGMNNEHIKYEAGQFLTFLLAINNRELRRSYSISSAPEVDNHLAVTLKRIRNGEVSRWLLDTIQPGSLITSLLPAGRFVIETQNTYQRDIFFVAAGSGITPIFSLIKKVLFTEPLSNVVLIYQNHDEESMIFRRQLYQLAEIFPEQFKWITLFSNPTDPGNKSRRLNSTDFEKYVSENTRFVKEQSLFYICGPGALMRMAKFSLKVMGYSDMQIRTENFVIDPSPPPFFSIDPAPRSVTIHYGKKAYPIIVSYPTNILEAALNNNVQIPYSCRGGRCTTCVAKCIEGKVKMSINEVLTPKDLNKGLILTCVGYAETDVVVSFDPD